MVTTTLVGLFITLSLGADPVQADFYVAPQGDDANPGTSQAPFASLARARDAVRALVRAGLKKDVAVLIRDGVYTVDAPVVFGPEDSGTGQYRITYAAYPGETPVFRGGRTITGWTKSEGNKWVAELPEVKAGAWRFRQLFLDGVRLPRGRFPNAPELLRVASVSPDVKQITLNAGVPFVGELAGKDAELVMYQNWSISRVLIVSAQGKTLTLKNPMGWIGHGDATTASPEKPTYVENAVEFVDQPGEWCLDRATGVLTYMAAEGWTPEGREFVAPRLEQLVLVAGRPDAPVGNLHFEGLAFEYSEWPLPDFGYLGIQAGHHGTTMKEPFHVLPPALEFTYAVDCSLERCRVAHTGACGIGFGIACRKNKVAGCEVFDIGGNGIMVGWRGKGMSHAAAGNVDLASDWPNPTADAPAGNEVSNCVVRACGAVNHGCVGIFAAFSADTKVAHNLVTDMPYTGISIGFRWDESPTSQRGCLCEYNRIHDVMKMLADGGGIYTLGLQPGTVLRGNLIYDVHRSAFAHGGAPNNGIFFDQGSKGYLVEGNTIYDTAGGPVRFNQTSESNMTWKDNSFGIRPGDAKFPEAASKLAGPQTK